MSFERLEALAKEHYTTMPPRYSGHRIHMSRGLSARLMQRYKPDIGDKELTKLRDTIFGRPLLYELMGIPIINDVGITDELQWILVDATGEEVERGSVTPDHDETKCTGEYKNCKCACPACVAEHVRRFTHDDASARIVQGADGSRTE